MVTGQLSVVASSPLHPTPPQAQPSATRESPVKSVSQRHAKHCARDHVLRVVLAGADAVHGHNEHAQERREADDQAHRLGGAVEAAEVARQPDGQEAQARGGPGGVPWARGRGPGGRVGGPGARRWRRWRRAAGTRPGCTAAARGGPRELPGCAAAASRAASLTTPPQPPTPPYTHTHTYSHTGWEGPAGLGQLCGVHALLAERQALLELRGGGRRAAIMACGGRKL